MDTPNRQPADQLAAPTEAENVILTVENSAHIVVAKATAYKKQAIAATAIIIAISLLYAIISHYQEKTENNAWNGIFVAEFTARQKSKETGLGEQLQKQAGALEGSKAAFYACMRELAEAGAGKDRAAWEKAAAAGQKFVRDFPGQPFINQVRLDYAAVLTNLGKYAEAEEQYDAVISSGTADERASARMFSALLQERAGKLDAARDLYARLANDPENGEVAAAAAFARLRLEEKMNQAAAPAPASAPAAPAPAAPVAAPEQTPAAPQQ